MALKDRLRHLTRSSRSDSTPPPHNPLGLAHASTTPSPSLSKTSSRLNLNLSKTLTFGTKSSRSSAEKKRERIEEWARRDEAEWRTPSRRRAGRKSQIHQDTLRAFAWGCHGDGDGATGKSGVFGERKGSGWSGVSPGTSRINSVDDAAAVDAGKVERGG